jgi:4-amino-4-deoxy-L-arabinose transferase-like glycosyltransferase
MLGQRLFGEMVPAVVAGCLFACHPLLIFATGLLYSETLYLFLLLLFTFSCLKMAEGVGRKGWAVVGGLLLGTNVLMKPNLLLFPLALVLWLWFALRHFRRALMLGGLVALVLAAVVLPWTFRNYRVSGALIPVSANAGLNLWQGNHPDAEGAAYPLDKWTLWRAPQRWSGIRFTGGGLYNRSDLTLNDFLHCYLVR